jgi:hypothetical protein
LTGFLPRPGGGFFLGAEDVKFMSSSSASTFFFLGAGGFQFSGLSYLEGLISPAASSIFSAFYLLTPAKCLDVTPSPSLPLRIPIQ